MKSLTFYEFAGIVLPGTIVLFGVSILFPNLKNILFNNSLSVGDFGLVLILAYTTGQVIQAIGNFVVDGEGNISFNSVELPKEFMQPVVAERVIRLDAEHSILVGDKETTNIAMTEYLNEETPKKDRWWIWAIVLGAVAVSLILLYAADKNASAEFGNAIKTSFLP